MDMHLEKCAECKELFSAHANEDRCPACEREAARIFELIDAAIDRKTSTTARKVAEITGLPLDTVKRVVRSSRSLSDRTLLEEPCKRCKDREAIRHSEYCALCILAIESSLRDAVDELRKSKETKRWKPEDRVAKMNVLSAMREKRRRTGSSRFTATPRSVKGGGI